MLGRLTSTIVSAVLISMGAPAPALAGTSTRAVGPRAGLARILADYEAYDRAENPIASGLEGDRAALSRWPGVTPADDARRRARLRAFQVRLEGLSPKGLTDEERLNLALLRWQVDLALEGLDYDEGRLAFTNEGGPEAALRFLETMTVLRSRADAEAYLARLEAVARSISDATANLRRGVATGFVQSRMTTEVYLAQLKAELARPVTDDGGPLRPLARLPEDLSGPEQQALRLRARRTLETRIRPALEAFAKTVETEVLPVAPAPIGALHLPNGRAYYSYLARFHTSTRLTPDQIHALGLREVARIRAAMEKEMAASGFQGTFPEFLAFLRSDPRFYATSREALMEASARIAKRADDELPRLFGRLPRLPYGVREVSRAIEENYTSARYEPGSPRLGLAGGLMVNTSHLDQRPLYEHPALMLHEGVPGHHLQGALQQELEHLPWFRRQADVTAFVEGWGLYAEFLGYDMGMYRDPYERFGALSMEMWRACRLVADTGIHWKGWTLEQARACFLENSAMAPKNVENELQRYISWPGQALAYKVGELKLRELRLKAEAELGPRFDLRRFHDEILGGGSLPLDLLETRIHAWIAREKTPREGHKSQH